MAKEQTLGTLGHFPIERGTGSTDLLRPVMWRCNFCRMTIEGDSDGSVPEKCPNCSETDPKKFHLMWNRLKELGWTRFRN